MKRQLCLFLSVLLCLVLFCSCGAKTKSPGYYYPGSNQNESQNSDEPEDIAEYVDPSLLRLAVEDQYNPNAGYEGEDVLLARTYYVYDSEGNNTRKITRISDGVCSVIEMEYDGAGNCIQEIQFNYIYDGEWVGIKIFYEHYEDGKISRKTVYDSSCYTDFSDEEYHIDGYFEYEFDHDCLYEYDEAGGMITETRLHKDGSVDYSTSYPEIPADTVPEYDEHGNIIRKLRYNKSNEVYAEMTFVYDEYGNLLRSDIYDYDGEHESYTVYTYAPYTSLLNFFDSEAFAESILRVPESLNGDTETEEYIPAGDPGFVPEEGDSEALDINVLMSHSSQIEFLGTCVSGMIGYPGFEIYNGFFPEDNLSPSYLLMAIWAQEKDSLGSGVSEIPEDIVVECIEDIFGITPDFTGYSIPSAYDIPVSYSNGIFYFDLSEEGYSSECLLDYAEPSGDGFICYLDVECEGRRLPKYEMIVVPSGQRFTYKVISMRVVG